jgi:protein tyrosine/serine phosphatase
MNDSLNPSPNRTSNLARWLRRMLISILILAVAPAIFVIDAIRRANFSVIVDGEAYRSGQMNAEQLARVIKQYGIKSVINLLGTNKSIWYRNEFETSEQLGVRHYDFGLSANQEVSLSEMDEIVKTLRVAPKPILIHCKAGADRSGLVSALYCLAIKGETPAQADRELSIWYGHIPLAPSRTVAMDHSFWRYVSNYGANTNELLAP